MKKIKVLHVVGSMNMGGQEIFVMNVMRNMDRNKYQFEFVVHSKNNFFDEEIKQLGGKIHYVTPFSKNPIKSLLEFGKILKNNKYDVIHRHTNNSFIFIELIVAKMRGIKKRICHSHSNIGAHKFVNYISRPFLNLFSTHRFACSQEAGRWLFGKKNFEIIKNGIDFSKFKFDSEIRTELRKRHDSDGCFIIGHVGRFDQNKNQNYLIDIFNKLISEDDNCRLWLFGDGELKKYIEEKVSDLCLKDKVVFFGIKENVSDYINAFDCFAFPSIYEGLGISLIEAQINGVPCVVSDNITDEAIIVENTKKINLENKNEFLNEIKNIKKIGRTVGRKLHNYSSFDIKNTCYELCEVYGD